MKNRNIKTGVVLAAAALFATSCSDYKPEHANDSWGSGGTNSHHESGSSYAGSGNNNFLLWYMLGRSMSSSPSYNNYVPSSGYSSLSQAKSSSSFSSSTSRGGFGSSARGSFGG